MNRRSFPPAQKILNAAILAMASLVGLGSFFYPFFVPEMGGGTNAMAHSQDAPLIFVLLVVLCLGAVLSSLAGGLMNAKLTAVLGILTAANAVLRGVPGPAGDRRQGEDRRHQRQNLSR